MRFNLNQLNSSRFNKSDVTTAASSDASTFDFTKIETLFSNSSTNSGINKSDFMEADLKDDSSVGEVKVSEEKVCLFFFFFEI